MKCNEYHQENSKRNCRKSCESLCIHLKPSNKLGRFKNKHEATDGSIFENREYHHKNVSIVNSVVLAVLLGLILNK